MLSEKTDQRCIYFSFGRGRAEFDLNHAGMFAHNAVDLRIRNDVNAENCHGADRSRTDVKLLDEFWRGTYGLVVVAADSGEANAMDGKHSARLKSYVREQAGSWARYTGTPA